MEPAASASAHVKNKASFSLIEAFSRSQSSKVNNKSTKEIANSNTSSKNKTSSINRISLLINNNNESVSPLFLIPGSMSSSDLQCSTSSLQLALAANSTDDEGLKIIANEFHHVSS